MSPTLGIACTNVITDHGKLVSDVTSKAPLQPGDAGSDGPVPH
jgi:hypothetical protein